MPKTTGSLMRFAVKFLKENGEWQLWCLRDYPDVAFYMKLNMESSQIETDAIERPLGDIAVHCVCENGAARFGYSKLRVADMEPDLPGPL